MDLTPRASKSELKILKKLPLAGSPIGGFFYVERGAVLILKCWFQRGTAADGNGESAVRIRHCPAAVNHRLSAEVSQNARQTSKRRGSYERTF